MKGSVAAALLLAFLLAACAPDRSANERTQGAPVDDAVVAAARDAGIEDCPPGGAGGGDLVCLATGEPVDLFDLDGPVVVNVWAHWCEPCREELPLLARAAREYAGEVTFVGVLFADEDPEAAVELAVEAGVAYPQAADRSSSLRVPLSLRGLPATVFLVDGEVVGAQPTPYTDYGGLVSDIAEHLEVGS
ncbi:MAG: TlpA disulfide reductase family protein [Aeromicrobium sp.]|uniref:TlpA family protein disulfide reductase n=1 Tax=Aeromicrobium sp. TaxID=1871063 RepID=UPI0039E421A3